MGDNILINGVPVDLSPPGAESVTRVSLNRRVDDMVNVTRAFTRTIDSMALNFHGAYDKHVDELERLAQDMSEKIIELKDKNTELVKANQDVELKFQVAQGEITGLIETVAELNSDKRNLEMRVSETSAKYRRLNENVSNLLNTTRCLIANIAPLQEVDGKREASLRLLESVTERLRGLERFFEDPIALPADAIPVVPPPLPTQTEATPKPPPAGLAQLPPAKRPPPGITDSKATPPVKASPIMGGHAPPVNEPAADTAVKASPADSPVTGAPGSSQRSSSPNKIHQRQAPVNPQAGEPAQPAQKRAPRAIRENQRELEELRALGQQMDDRSRLTADAAAGGPPSRAEPGTGAYKPPPPGYEARAAKPAPPILEDVNVPKPSPPTEWTGAGPQMAGSSTGEVVPPPMPEPIQRTVVEVKRFARRIIEDNTYRPLYHVKRGSNVVNQQSPEFDVNFRPETNPDNVVALTIKTRDNWRRFKGSFVDHLPRKGLRTPGGRTLAGNSGADFNDYDDVFVEIYGQHAYGFLGYSVLKGPDNWRSELSALELTKHDEWVNEVGHIQSLFDDGYVPPLDLSDLDPRWFHYSSCPDTQVYVNHSPEMNERQLNSLLLTWAGMLPHGNPTIVSVKHLTENTYGPHGWIHNGVTVIRFASHDLALLYCRYLNGLQVHYRNFFIEELELKTQAELTGKINMPRAVWHQTILVVELNNEGTMKSLFRDNWPADSVTDRDIGHREKLCWFGWLPCDDFPTWLTDPIWTVNPFTGDACERYLSNNPGSRPLLKAPHASYWRAIGTYNNIANCSIKGCDEGCWLNDNERVRAYQDDDYYDTDQALNRVQTHTAASVRGRRLPQSRGSRSISVRRPRQPV